MELALQYSEVSAEVAAALLMCALSLASTTGFSAMASAELLTPSTMSTPSRSNHCRAMLRPTSDLFWWSATSSSTPMAGLAAANSRTAWRAQMTLVGPEMSR
jgi:hypothetical protein